MKNILDYHSRDVTNIFDDLSLWAAPFGRLLLENIPMKRGRQVLDLGFGTGFPLVELSQRFGGESHVYGMDIWKSGIERTKEKIRVLELKNITIFEQDATSIPLENNQIDLICSNLGINNFEKKEIVLLEAVRVLKDRGHLCITTNPIGTFQELFNLFEEALTETNLTENIKQLHEYIDHRGTEKSIINEFEQIGFKCLRIVRDVTNIRFSSANAVFRHSLMRIGFLESWLKLVPENKQLDFFKCVHDKIDNIINSNGAFRMNIPMLYLEFVK